MIGKGVHARRVTNMGGDLGIGFLEQQANKSHRRVCTHLTTPLNLKSADDEKKKYKKKKKREEEEEELHRYIM